MEEIQTVVPSKGSPGRLEALIPAGILILRLATHRTPWYFDWMIVLSLYWLLHVLCLGEKARRSLALGAMILLMGMYLARVFPILVDTLLFCL